MKSFHESTSHRQHTPLAICRIGSISSPLIAAVCYFLATPHGITMGFFYSQLFKSIPYPTGSYTGKTIIITGGNGGLGREAARHFVRLGASKMILAVRSLTKGHEAKLDIESTTGCGKSIIEVWELDMAHYASVQQFADRVVQHLDRVDIFLANAGIAPAQYKTAEDNEASITVNVVSTFLLAALVMPKLKATAAKFHTRPTLSITSSAVHEHTTLPQKSCPEGQIFATVNDKVTANKHWADMYAVSKLFEVFGVRALAEKHPAESYPVTINCTNPGLCHSDLGREYNGFGFWLLKFLVARSTEVGGRILVHGGTSGAESHGQYLDDCEVGAPSPWVLSEEGQTTQGRVWKELVTKLESVKPGVTSNF